ncbi:MAG TPA: hypothetical protein VK489_07370 [Ferruginibacter sp.]|nr:hypothetical protein [Ferruginibacter sp.]
MHLKITGKYIVAFIALNFIMGELHEQAHINTGFFICSCYGPRDFNVWSTCEDCPNASWAYIATLAGPLFSCTLMWLGAYWFSWSANENKRMIGFSLLFANLPFARIFTALVGGGDEKIVIQSLMNDNSNSFTSRIIASIIVILVCLPPMIIAGRQIWNKNKWFIVVGFSVVPLIYGMLYQRMFLNRLLKNDVLSATHILGTPDLVLLHFCLVLAILFVFQKGIFELGANQR